MTTWDIAPRLGVEKGIPYFKRRGWGADNRAVLLSQVQPGLRLLILPGRMCGCTAVDWKLVAAVLREETTEILLLFHDFLSIFWYDSIVHCYEWIIEWMYDNQLPTKVIS
jgi:hypothetical protein